MLERRVERDPAAEREADERGTVDVERVEHADDVLDPGERDARALGAAVEAQVETDAAKALRQCAGLRLPEAQVAEAAVDEEHGRARSFLFDPELRAVDVEVCHAATIACVLMELEHVLVVGAGQMGGGIAQVVAASGRRVTLVRRRAGRRRAWARRDREEPHEARGEGGRRSCRGAGAYRDGGRPRARRPDDRGGRRERRRQARHLPASRCGAAGDGVARLQHLVDPDHAARRGDLTTGPGDRHAFLQPRAGAEARRGDPRPRDLRRDRGRRSRRSRSISARRLPRRATCPASSPTAS